MGGGGDDMVHLELKAPMRFSGRIRMWNVELDVQNVTIVSIVT